MKYILHETILRNDCYITLFKDKKITKNVLKKTLNNACMRITFILGCQTSVIFLIFLVFFSMNAPIIQL